MADRSDAGVLALLIVDGILTGAVGLAFTPLYLGAVPVPLGVVLSVLVLPWLVLRAGEIDRRFAGAPVFAWFATVAVPRVFDTKIAIQYRISPLRLEMFSTS